MAQSMAKCQTCLEKGDILGTFDHSDEISNRNGESFGTKKIGCRSRQIYPWMTSRDRGDVKIAFR